ncbi:MAG: hypothetical protein KME18_00220 [Phormidium tanganyikae FI6-MK23]|jgi:hypothetical protein|nr:hypothetical protein [Phormidium tanganyikae FI6-MK23]
MPQPQSWEFLIQQDGDRVWLPLDTPNVEILEGRYRIAAKSNRKNAPVEVRIKHDSIDEMPPKRRTQTRTHQTNPSGLMPVIPFTRLQPGIWEFQCAPREGSLHSIQLRVLSIESDIVEDWNPDWENADQATFGFTTSETKAVEPDHASIEEILQRAEQESGTIADEILTEYGLVSEAPYQEDRLPKTVSLGDAIVSIELVQETFIANRGEPLTISGQITSAQVTHLDAELRVCLRDPQTSKTLLDTRETLQQEALPFGLSYRVTLPVDLETQLILGEITLHDATVEGKPIVATQSFTLMADVNELLDAMYQAKKDDRTMAEDMLDLPATNPVVHPPLNLAFLNLVATPKDSEAANFTPKETQALPPQLHQPNPYTRKKLNLPSFGVQPDAATPEYTDVTQLEIPLTAASIPSQPEVEAPLEEPLLDRLTPLEEAEPASELKVQADDLDLIQLDEPEFDLQPSPDQVIDEFVVDDEPILPLADLIVSRRRSADQSDRAQNPLLLPESEPVPDPIVTIAESELIGGKTAIVRIKLPDLLPKIYVKVWISDRQNRTIIEPPRWVIDFKPDGHHNLEAITEVKVPFESVEIQIEAIAVEVMTNRESHKVIVDRRIVPEALPDLWLDDLDADSIVSP